jgi:pSer/pThr/pTyr-binding forkhead associated (FHA) protein
MFQEACGASLPLELDVFRSRVHSPERVTLDRPFGLIGSDRRCEIRLKSTGVAPRHAYLQRVAGRTFILDLGSRKGLELQKKNCASGWLRSGESLVIGPYRISANAECSNGTAWPDDLDPLEAGSVDRVQLPTVLIDLPNDRGTVQRRRIDRVLTLVGRAPCCHLRFSDPSVPRIQCALLLTQAGLWVIDLGGREGTCVNGCQVRWAHMEDGASLQIGRGMIRAWSQCARRSDSVGPFLEAVSLGAHPVERPLFESGSGNDQVPIADIPNGLSPAAIAIASTGGTLSGTRSDGLQALVPFADASRSDVTTQQLATMQQQMLIQFQQSMMMMAQTFSGMWQAEMELLREVLDRLGGLKRQVRGVSARQKASAKRAKSRSRAAVEKPERNGAKTHADDTVPMTPPKQEQPVLPAFDAAAAANVDPNFHIWLNERMASLDHERQGAWQKLVAILLGK